MVFPSSKQSTLRNLEKQETCCFHIILIITLFFILVYSGIQVLLLFRFYCPDLADEKKEASETYTIGK